MEDIYSHFIFKLIISVLLGTFLGIRREMSSDNGKKLDFIGIRTVAILCSLGTISTFFDSLPYLPIIFFSSIFILIAIAYTYGAFKLGRIGLTTELSAMIIFWIGVFIGYGEPIIAIIITIFIAGVDTFKKKLHIFVSGLSEKEWGSALAFLTLSGAILPFLPNEAVDPLGIFVPFTFWLIVMLISGIGFVGYFLTKYLGTSAGIMLTSFFGSLISSTAVTISMASKSKKIEKSSIYAIGIFIAIVTMQFRVILEMLIVGNNIITFDFFIIPAIMIIIAGIIIFYFLKKNKKKNLLMEKNGSDIELQDPFEIKPALQFSLLFIIILLLLKFGKQYFGDTGVYIISILSGITDVDIIVISSIESFKHGEIGILVARNAIIFALVTNTLIKIMYVFILGSRKLFYKVAACILIIVTGSLIGFFI